MGKYKHYYYHPVRAALAKRQRLLGLLVALGMPTLFLLVSVTNFILPHPAAAASYTWDGGGATNNWSDCDNWSTNVCPVAADTVTFNATSTKDSVIDASWGGSLTGLTIASGYTGTISMDRSLTMSGAFSQADGNFTAGSQTLDLNSTFALSGGSFTASSGTMSVANSFTISGSGAFAANGGTLVFDSAAGGAIACNGATFNAVQVITDSSSYKTVSSDCALPVGANPSVGRVLLSGSLVGSGTLTFTSGSAADINAGGTLVGFNGLVGGSIRVNGGNLDLSSYTTVDINGSFAMTSGTFTAPAGDASFAFTFTITGGTFNHNNGRVIFDGGNATIACNNVAFNVVQITALTGSKTINSDCILPVGADPNFGAAGSVVLNGTITGLGTLTASGLRLNAGSVLLGFNGYVGSGTLQIEGTTANFGSYTTFDLNGTFTLGNAAGFIAPSITSYFGGVFNITSPTAGANFDANGGTIELDGGSATITCNGAVFNSVVINATGTKTVSNGCTLPLGNDPTAAGGISLSGVLTGTGTLTRTGATTVNATGNITGFTNMSLPGLTVTGAVLDFSSWNDITLTGSTTYTQTGGIVTSPSGTFNGGGFMNLTSSANFIATGDVDANNFTLSSGSVFTASPGDTYIAGNFTINSGTTFNANGGTVIFDAGAATLACGGTIFNLVKIQKVSSTTTINNNCTLPLGNDPQMPGAGSLVLNGYFTGSGDLSKPDGGAMTLNNPDALSMFSNITTGALTLNASQDWSNTDTMNLSGSYVQNTGTVIAPHNMSALNFQLSVGSFTAPSGNMTVIRAFTVAVGTTFNHNNGTVIFAFSQDGSRHNIICNGATFNLVIIQATRYVRSGCSLPLGNDPTAMGTAQTWPGLYVEGELTGSGVLTVGEISTGQGLILTGGGRISGFSALVSGRLDITATTNTDLSGLDYLDIANRITVGGNSALTAPPVINLSGYTFTVEATSAFHANNGTVVLSGTNQALTGDIAFHNLTKTTSGTVTVGAGNTITTTGLLKLSRPSLVSSAPGTPWNLNMQGTTNICYVSVTDSVGTGNSIVAYQSNSYSTNPGWVFLNAACPGSGGGGGGTGGEPTSTVTNYTQAQAAATAATLTTPSTTLPPYHGLPSTLAKTVDTIPGSREALRAFLRFVGVTFGILAVVATVWWIIGSKRKREQEDTFDVNQLPSSWNHTKMG